MTLPPPAASVPPRDAIIYIPGLFRPVAGELPNTVPARIAYALDWNSSTKTAVFSTRSDPEATKALRGLATVTSVLRKDGANERPIIDIYEFDYRETLITSTKRSPIAQAASLGGLLISVLGRVIGGISKPSKSRAEKGSVALGVAIFLAMAAYMVFLLLVGLAAAVDFGAMLSGTPLTKISGIARDAVHFVEAGVLAVGALGLFSTKGLRGWLDTASAELSAATSYLSAGQRVKSVQGRLAELLARIQEVQPAYDRVHVVAFSFGSLVAIDSVFPRQSAGRHWDAIDSLVTIGCPFDFIRTYWPDHFGQRDGAITTPRAWYNVYAPQDLLGSDFTDATYDFLSGKAKEIRDVGIQLRDGSTRVPNKVQYGDEQTLTDLGIWSQLSLRGFRAHMTYWDDAENAASCFTPVVQRLFEGHHALS